MLSCFGIIVSPPLQSPFALCIHQKNRAGISPRDDYATAFAQLPQKTYWKFECELKAPRHTAHLMSVIEKVQIAKGPSTLRL